MPILYNIGKGLAVAALTAFARLQVEGREAVLPRGPLIVVSNHMSNADPVVLVAAMKRRLFFLAKRGLFANWWASAILHALGVYPLKRDGKDVAALLRVLRLLERDKAMVLFPEGTRSRDAQMHKVQPGIAYIALKSQAPILPIGITGTEKIPGFWRIALPFCSVKVNIGQPFTLPSLEGKPNQELLQHLADTIMYRVAALLPEQYRGYYQLKQPQQAV